MLFFVFSHAVLIYQAQPGQMPHQEVENTVLRRFGPAVGISLCAFVPQAIVFSRQSLTINQASG